MNFHFFHKDTGILHGLSVNSNINDPRVASDRAALSAPPDHMVIEGHYDHQSQRVDIATGKVVDYQPPQPSPDHEWNASTKRWQLSAAVTEKQDRRRVALAQIASLEVSQNRPLRELAANANDITALSRLRSIDEAIQRVRRDL